MTQLNQSSMLPGPSDEHRFIEDVVGFLGILRRGWHYIAVSTVVCLTITALYLTQLKTVYKGASRLLILQQGGRPLSNIVSGGRQIIETSDDLSTHLRVIPSPVILDRAVETAKIPGLSVASVLGGLTVTRPDPGVKIIELGYQAQSAEEATKVIDAVVASFREFLDENYQKSATDVLGLIAKVRDDLSNELKDLEQKYLEFHRQHPVFTVGKDGRSLLVRRLDQWDGAANEAMMRAVKLQSQLDLARKLSKEGAGLGTIGSTLRFLGDESKSASLTGVDDEAPEGSIEQLSGELANTERQRRTVERLLDHLRSEQAGVASTKPVSEAEVTEAFFADPEASRLRQQLDSARSRRDSIQRVARSIGDPSLSQAQRRVRAVQEELDRLWKRRRPAIIELLCRSSGSDLDAAIRREEANLIVLKSSESVLREELQALQDLHDPKSGPESVQPTVALAAAAPVAPRSGGPVEGAGAAGSETPPQKAAADDRSKAEPESHSQVRVHALIETIERGLRANEALREEMARRFKEELALGKDTEIERLEEENLRANLERHRTLFNSVVDQLKQAQLVSDNTIITAQAISPTVSFAVRPRRTYLLLGALVAGCGLGIVIAYLVDLFDARLRTLPNLRRALDFPLLGLIPQLPAEKHTSHGMGLVCHALPRSPAAEAYKSIRTNLEFHRRSRQLQVLLVTSPHPGDGKSTTASNLATSLAQSGYRILLVDGDLRRPSLHVVHERERSRGLILFLKDVLPLKCLTQQTAVPNLDFLAAGPRVANPAELLGSPRFREFLTEVRQAYDMVLIDSSPLLAVTDPQIVGSVVDGVVLVARATSLHRHEAERTSELLKAIGTPVIGTVVNGFTRQQTGYGYSNGYGYGYGYGYGRVYGEGHDGAGDGGDVIPIVGNTEALPALESSRSVKPAKASRQRPPSSESLN